MDDHVTVNKMGSLCADISEGDCMMRISRLAMTGVAVLAVGAISAPAFAAGSSSVPSLTIDYISKPTITTSKTGDKTYQYTVKVSGLVYGSGDFVVFEYNVTNIIQGNGTIIGNYNVQQSGSEIFTLSFTQASTASPATNLAVAEFHDGISNFIQQPSPITTLSELPYGQLPEVPWAAGLPLVGLGAGMWLWKRQSSMAR